ncbi:MAG TPA: class II fructose-bisphosphate aldolase [Candidatus Hydrogenedentes bacterium]|nr:class II fructose-bisphosphate aldolase [Candidatus Hydrogenedentota bacterium]
MPSNREILSNAARQALVVPSFNVPYLPMVEPVVRAVVDTDSFAFIATARLEWYKYEAKGLRPVFDAFQQWNRPDYVALHLDHVPVIDEDNRRVDYRSVLKEALEMGYHSVMIDGSRLPFAENIEATRAAVALAHGYGVACEAELGAVMGHESGPMPPYEEIFASGKGFTDVDEARRFVGETGCDWLSVAIGNVHGAVSEATRHQKKIEARLDIAHLVKLREATGLPLVLHGGSGVQRPYVLKAIENGIAKVNVCTEIRQPYEKALSETNDLAKAQEACYERTRWVIADYFGIAGTRRQLLYS